MVFVLARVAWQGTLQDDPQHAFLYVIVVVNLPEAPKVGQRTYI